MVNKIFKTIGFFSCVLFLKTVFAVTVEPIERELVDVYRSYHSRLSEPARETILAIKPIIEFYDDEVEMLLSGLIMNVRRMFPALKTSDMYIIVYVAIYETMLSEDELYVYPTLAEYNKNNLYLNERRKNYESISALMDDYKNREPSAVSQIELVGTYDPFKDLYTHYNLSKGELDAAIEMEEKLKLKHDMNLMRREMFIKALYECIDKLSQKKQLN